MNTLKQWISKNNLSRLLLVAIAGLILVFNTACNAPRVSTADPTARSAADQVYGESKPDDRGSMIQNEPSLNENNARAKARAKELVGTAQKNLDNPNRIEDLSEQAKQTAKELPGEIADRVKSQKDDFVKGTERGAKNLKENLKEASKEIPDVVKEAAEGAKDKLK
jgi:guanylate kinase